MPERTSAAAQAPGGARAEGKRRAIIDAALKIFLAEGSDASMDRVAAAAGVSKVTVYNHFQNKENLFVAVVSGQLEKALEDAREFIESQLGSSVDIRTDLMRVCRSWVAGLTSPEMLALRILVAEEARRFPELGSAWMDRGPGRLHAVIAAALRRLNERRQVDIPDVDLAVTQLSGLVVSPSVMYRVYGSVPSPEVTDRLIVAGVDMFLNYYGRPE